MDKDKQEKLNLKVAEMRTAFEKYAISEGMIPDGKSLTIRFSVASPVVEVSENETIDDGKEELLSMPLRRFFTAERLAGAGIRRTQAIARLLTASDRSEGSDSLKTVEDLTRRTKTELMRRYKNCGQVVAEKANQVLMQCGLSLRKE
ncbi:MAG: hypothetical protein PHS53_00815 [Candidatus Pacebacteria bacterium]|nr:hypothetical protein [Candidatus Paceibacterota bacterium]